MGEHRRIYLDNAATSFPKPASVLAAMTRYSTEVGSSARGVYAEARQAGAMVDACRASLAKLLGCASARHVVFTLNCSDAMNLAVHGALGAWRRRQADQGRTPRVVASALDHNSFLRPLHMLADRGEIELTLVGFDPASGQVDPDEVVRAIGRDTALVALLHSSNVTGVVQPLGPIGRACRERGVLFVVDAAQSAGHTRVEMDELHADLLCVAGHKGLLGPTGTGGLLIRPGVEHRLETTRQGGTGSRYELDRQPDELPEKYEPGSHNTIGIVGLGAGVDWLLDHGVDRIGAHERQLGELMVSMLNADECPGLALLGPRDLSSRLGVYSFVHEAIEPQALALELEVRFGVLGRAGLHCAPLAHRAMGTTGDAARLGAFRLSLGTFVSEDEVRAACEGLRTICRERAALVSRSIA